MTNGHASAHSDVADAISGLRHATRQWPRQARKRLSEAVSLAERAHSGQYRVSGEPYVCHPIAVASIVAQNGGELDTVIAAILHDTVEDTALTLADIEEAFGGGVSSIVDGCTKISEVRVNSPDALEAARTRKLLVALARDPRVIVVKAADRLHNLRTIGALPAPKRERIGRETLALHGPLAGRVGLSGIKAELEDRAFAAAYPTLHADVSKQLHTQEKEHLLGSCTRELSAHLRRNGVHGSVSGRIKMPWSAYRKAELLGIPVDKLHDTIGLRVIVPTLRDCYVTLGVVHTLWVPAEGRIKDYIARPKFNRYQSLHTVVIATDGTLVEVQIRTPEMHAEAEHGKAAHRAYKNADPDEPAWLQRLLDHHEEDDRDYLNAVHRELLSDEEVLALTPEGDVHVLPVGASVLDFAYSVHTEVGHGCVGAEVNGKSVPLATPLRSGDRVRIVTGRDSDPPEQWLDYAITRKARTAIKARRRKLLGAQQEEAGRTILEAVVGHDLGATLAAGAEDTLNRVATGALHAYDALALLNVDTSNRPSENHRTLLEVVAEDRVGMLGKVATALAAAGGNIEFSSATNLGDGNCRELFDLEHACGRDTILAAARAVPGVLRVNVL